MPPPEHFRPMPIAPLPDYHHNGDASLNVPKTLMQIVRHLITAESIALASEQPQANIVDYDLHKLAIDEELRMTDLLQAELDVRRARIDGKRWGDHVELLAEELDYETSDSLRESGERLLRAMEEIY